MELFFQLEAGYLGIAVFVLVVTLIVTTRSFVSKNIWKKSLLVMGVIMGIFIGIHYLITIQRMAEVESAFSNGEKVICESREIRKVAQSIVIEKNNDWNLENHLFISLNYERGFFTSRCIKSSPIELEKLK